MNWYDLYRLINILIDERIERDGFTETIDWLINHNIGPEELVEVFGFDEKEIQCAIDEIERW